MTNSSPNHPLFSRREILAGILFLGAFILALFLFAGFLTLALGVEPPPPATAILLTLFEAVIILPPWFFISRKHLGWASLGLRGFRPGDLVLGCAFLVFAYLFNFAWAVFLVYFDLPLPPDILPIFGEGPLGYVSALIAAGVVAPISEEIYFRGFVFAGLREHWGVVPALIASAAVFAIFHFIPVIIPAIFLLGLFMAAVYHLSGSLWPSIFMHATFNLLGITCIYLES